MRTTFLIFTTILLLSSLTLSTLIITQDTPRIIQLGYGRIGIILGAEQNITVNATTKPDPSNSSFITQTYTITASEPATEADEEKNEKLQLGKRGSHLGGIIAQPRSRHEDFSLNGFDDQNQVDANNQVDWGTVFNGDDANETQQGQSQSDGGNQQKLDANQSSSHVGGVIQTPFIIGVVSPTDNDSNSALNLGLAAASSAPAIATSLTNDSASSSNTAQSSVPAALPNASSSSSSSSLTSANNSVQDSNVSVQGVSSQTTSSSVGTTSGVSTSNPPTTADANISTTAGEQVASSTNVTITASSNNANTPAINTSLDNNPAINTTLGTTTPLGTDSIISTNFSPSVTANVTESVTAPNTTAAYGTDAATILNTTTPGTTITSNTSNTADTNTTSVSSTSATAAVSSSNLQTESSSQSDKAYAVTSAPPVSYPATNVTTIANSGLVSASSDVASTQGGAIPF